jgi:RNA polymerase sigma-70 factor (ECF subfamily)
MPLPDPPRSHPGRASGERGRVDRPAEDAEERALVGRIQRGDARAWADLLERYQHRVYAICLRLTGSSSLAEDLAQDALVRVIEGLANYDGRAGVSTWVYRVTVNSCLTRLRSERYRRHAPLDASGPDRRAPGPVASPGGEHAPERRVQREDRERRLLLALDRIEPDQRAILVLRDVQGLDYDTIGSVLGVPVGTVKSRLFRARAALRRAMEELGGGSDE